MISLEPVEVKMIRDVLGKRHYHDWIEERIIKKLDQQEQDWKTVSECDHKPGVYTGKKECCVKCGSCYKPGDGLQWSLNQQGEPATK